MTDHTLHLRPDELDLLLEGRLSNDRTSHCETCEECRSALDELRDVVAQLNPSRLWSRLRDFPNS